MMNTSQGGNSYGQYQPPPQPQQYPGGPMPPKKKSNLPIIVIAVVVVIIIASIGAVILLGVNGGSRPKDAVRSLERAWNNKDADALIACDILNFTDGEEKERFKEWIQEEMDEVQLSFSNLRVVCKLPALKRAGVLP